LSTVRSECDVEETMERWLNVGVKGSATWPTEETTVEFGGHKLLLKPATGDTEQSIHINLNLSGIPSDVYAMTLINRFLSVLSWCDDQPMENLYGWSGNPVAVPVPRQVRTVGSSIAFPFYRDLESDRKTLLALALFREGRTVNSVPFEFLSYFKILNIFWKDKWSKGKNEMIDGIRARLPALTDDLAVSRLRDLRNREPDIAKYLYESGRCAIAHAYADPIVDPDDLSDIHRLSKDLNIVKAIAEHLIVNELKVSRSILG
jgi:hypothetical protein